MSVSFHKALLSAMGKTGKPLEEVASEANVPASTLKLFLHSDNSELNVDQAVRIAAVFDATLDQFLNNPELSGHVQIAQLYSALPPLLKAQLEAYAQELADEQGLSPPPKRQ